MRLGSAVSGQEVGVPQGSVLSVALFCVEVDGLVEVIGDGKQGSLCADDFVIRYGSREMNSVERQLQLCPHEVQGWAEGDGFKFSKTEAVCVHFCSKRRSNNDPCLHLD